LGARGTDHLGQAWGKWRDFHHPRRPRKGECGGRTGRGAGKHQCNRARGPWKEWGGENLRSRLENRKKQQRLTPSTSPPAETTICRGFKKGTFGKPTVSKTQQKLQLESRGTGRAYLCNFPKGEQNKEKWMAGGGEGAAQNWGLKRRQRGSEGTSPCKNYRRHVRGG